jgi:hypothetical protein
VEDIATESSIICVTESHLDTNIANNDIIIDGFSDQISRKDSHCFGGDVLVYSSQDICVKPRYDLNFASGEIIWYEVIIPNFKILICTVYRPPGSVAAFWENFSIEQAMNYTPNIIINGDLNVDLLRESNNKLSEIISEFNLTNVIKEPTRNGALLDPILVSNLNIVIDSEVISVNRDITCIIKYVLNTCVIVYLLQYLVSVFHNLRNTEYYTTPRSRLRMSIASFIPSTVSLWNTLDLNVMLEIVKIYHVLNLELKKKKLLNAQSIMVKGSEN